MSACTECHGMAGEKYDDHTTQYCPRLEQRQVATDSERTKQTILALLKCDNQDHTLSMNTAIPHEHFWDDLARWHHQQLEAKTTETAKAYGGCTNCYGKGYATVNDRWLAHDTDQDIGSPGGRFSGGNPNAMKYCKCARGKQLEAHVGAKVAESLERVRSKGHGGGNWRRLIEQELAHLISTKEKK